MRATPRQRLASAFRFFTTTNRSRPTHAPPTTYNVSSHTGFLVFFRTDVRMRNLSNTSRVDMLPHLTNSSCTNGVLDLLSKFPERNLVALWTTTSSVPNACARTAAAMSGSCGDSITPATASLAPPPPPPANVAAATWSTLNWRRRCATVATVVVVAAASVVLRFAAVAAAFSKLFLAARRRALSRLPCSSVSSMCLAMAPSL
mmetsp:Transcript_56387/g.138545  ORF Transcript_56387/g.138545 Transcript_56387/m.138545 type:complete len:203 (-) Transcript_56387:161-769(-)